MFTFIRLSNLRNQFSVQEHYIRPQTDVLYWIENRVNGKTPTVLQFITSFYYVAMLNAN